MINLLKNISFPRSFLNSLAIFLAIYQSQSKNSRSVLQKIRGDDLFYTTKPPRVPSNDRGRMNGWVDFGANQWF